MSNSTRSSFDLARSKAKLLRILPDLAEEEEFRGISPSSFLKPRRPERPCLDLYLDFPTLSEPASLTRSRATNLLPMCFRRPTHSPTSSISSSSAVSFMSAVSSQLSSTPATSEDEAASSTSKSSFLPDVNFKRRSSKSLPALPQFSDNLELSDSEWDEWDEESDGDDLEWIAQEMKDFISLSTFLPDDIVNARPESFLPNRSSKRLNNLSFHGPSAQLDPTFPFSPKKHPAPTDPLPSPPVSSGPILSLRTPSSSASISLSSMTTTSIRPPPRHSLPRDVDELMQMDRNDFEMIEDGFAQEWPDSLYSDCLGSPLTSLGFVVHDLPKRKSSFIGNAMPDSPIEKTHFPDPSIHQFLSSPSSPPPQLSSRWSTSTLASQKQLHSASLSSWMTKFSLRDKKSNTASPPPLPPSTTAAKTVQKQKHRRFNGVDLIRSRYESEKLHIDGHDSQSSPTSSDSNESASG